MSSGRYSVKLAPPRRRGKSWAYPLAATCAAHRCHTKPTARGFCQKHYMRIRNHGDPETKKTPGVPRSRYCKRGHDKDLPANRYKNGACGACCRKYAKDYRELHPEATKQAIPNLRAVRHRFGLTAKQLAKLAGLHYNTIYQLETGVSKTARKDTQRKLRVAVARLMTPGKVYRVMTEEELEAA